MSIGHEYWNGEVPERLRQPLLLIEEYLGKKYKFLGEGRHRSTYGNEHVVFKVPRNHDGFQANYLEYENYVKYPERCAKCRLVYKHNIPIIIMEKLDTNIYTKGRLNKLPNWAYRVDCMQVGYNRNREVRAFDYTDGI